MLLLEDRRARALKGYELAYPVILRTLADFLACGTLIWPYCTAGCRFRPPLDIPSLIAVKGQAYTVDELMRHLRCPDCGAACEIRISAERTGGLL